MPAEWLDAAAALLTAAALVVATLVWLGTRTWSPAMPVLLELLTAAGLLRLAHAGGSWRAIATAAAVVGVRTLVKQGAHAGRGVRGAGGRLSRR